jgi:hypothetical protein
VKTLTREDKGGTVENGRDPVTTLFIVSLDIRRRIDLLQFCAHDLGSPLRGLFAHGLLKLAVDPSAFAVGGLEGQRTDDMAEIVRARLTI